MLSIEIEKNLEEGEKQKTLQLMNEAMESGYHGLVHQRIKQCCHL